MIYIKIKGEYMQIEKCKIGNLNINFESKNTFLQKAKKARYSAKEHYYKSLHNEAKARMFYKKFSKAEDELFCSDRYDIFSFCKSFIKMAYRKIQSVIYDTKAFSEFPNRFTESDKCSDIEHRYYKIKKNYINKNNKKWFRP